VRFPRAAGILLLPSRSGPIPIFVCIGFGRFQLFGLSREPNLAPPLHPPFLTWAAVLSLIHGLEPNLGLDPLPCPCAPCLIACPPRVFSFPTFQNIMSEASFPENPMHASRDSSLLQGLSLAMFTLRSDSFQGSVGLSLLFFFFISPTVSWTTYVSNLIVAEVPGSPPAPY